MEQEILEALFYCIIFHILGKYVLQEFYTIFIKSKSWYHLLIHCILYVLPFVLYFGIYECFWYFLFIPHLVIYICKIKIEIIDDFTDKLLHFMYILAYGLCIWCYI